MATKATTTGVAANSKPSLTLSTYAQQQQPSAQQQQQHDNQQQQQPFHLLMVTDDDDVAAAEQRVRLEHPKLRRDYLSQRYLAFASIQNYQLQQQQLHQQQLQLQQQAMARSKKSGTGKKTAPMSATAAATATTSNNSATINNITATAALFPPPKEKHPFWSGASDVERSLVSCCQIPSQNDDHGGEGEDDERDDAIVPGALQRDKILHFLGLLAVKCTDLGSRALALSILERSWEADQKQADLMLLKQEEEGDDEDYASSPPARKRLRRNDNDDEQQQQHPVDKASNNKQPPPQPSQQQQQSDCLVMSFLLAGGLCILNQWLIEALTPIPVAKPPSPLDAFASIAVTTRNSSLATAAATAAASSSSTTTTTHHDKPSPFGTLLLPLLSFLAHMPFDQDLVKQSKINKRIRQLSKDVDAIVQQAQRQQQQQQQQPQQYANVSSSSSKVDETLTDPRTGGLSVLQVQEAVNTLKSTWVEKQKTSTAAPGPPKRPCNPFQSLKDRLKQRLEEVQEFESGTGPEPAWMVAAEAASQAAATAAAAKAASSTCPVQRKKHETQMAEMARREREKERQERMKGDIRKVKEERDKLLEKLRKLKHKQVAQQEEQQQHKSDSRKRVKWKDGLGAASLQRKRDQLEEVFVFCKDPSDSASLLSPHKTENPSTNNDDNDEESNGPTTAMEEETLLEGSTENASSIEDAEGEGL